MRLQRLLHPCPCVWKRMAAHRHYHAITLQASRVGSLPLPRPQHSSFSGGRPSTFLDTPIISCLCHRLSQRRTPPRCSKSNGADEDRTDTPSSPDDDPFQTFSRLPHVLWDPDTVVTVMISYLSILHIPLGLGGLSILAEQLNTKELDTQTKAVSLVIFQLLELGGATWLIKSSMKQSKHTLKCFNFDFGNASGGRGWLATATVGLATISMAMRATAFIVGVLHFHTEGDGKGEALGDMVSGNTLTQLSTFLVCCILTPCLEEIVYRGYLLQSLATQYGWQCAVIISSLAFTVAHFDISGAPSLFFVGCVLGAAYTWSGNLAASLFIHSFYNAFILYSIMLT